MSPASLDESPHGIDYQRLYDFRFRDVDQAARERVWRVIAPWVHERLGRPQRVLDPAAGRGEFINHVPAAERWAVDIVEHAHGVYAPGVRALTSDIFDADLPAAHFDGIWVSNFTEHLPTQEACGTFLRRMHAVCAPGGRIAVMGPNFRYAAREYFDFADHTLVFTHRGMAEHVHAAGFELEMVVARFLPYSFTGRLPPSALLTRLYLEQPFAWRLLGKQFLVVGRRR